MEGGIPTLILSAGYIGSTMFGGVLIMSGFDTLVAKIMSFIVGIGLLCPLVLVRDKLYVFPPLTGPPGAYLVYRTILLTLCYEGLLIGFWFVDHGCVPHCLHSPMEADVDNRKCRQALRWYTLFLGVMK